MKTVITHMYNEEYLLPWWLEHHKRMFDHGIIIDYDSTDRSVEIIKDICPHWQVVKSVNRDFNAENVDVEIMQYESQIEGWRICLNVPEFVMGDVDRLIDGVTESTQFLMPSVSFWEWNPDGVLTTNNPLWEQTSLGISYLTDFQIRRGRSIHNMKNVKYTVGRHYDHFNTEDLIVFHYANCIASKGMLDRRLQIQHRIPSQDRKMGRGFHHFYGNENVMTAESLKKFLDIYSANSSKVKDCSDIIKKYAA